MAGKENILQTIAAANRQRVAAAQAEVSAPVLEARARERAAQELAAAPGGAFAFPFEAALQEDGMSFICEVKKASPSKGLIAAEFDHLAIARDYEAAGAAAVSVLTEPHWFQGSLAYLVDISGACALPTLRKDFIVDAYQLFEAKLAGAAAVLLICSILDDGQLRDYIATCHELGMSALVEAYEPGEVPRALTCGARVVGVNNRDLRSFEVDFGRSIRLRAGVPADVLFVSESGVCTRADVAALEEAGVDAVLIGETLMRAADKRTLLDELRGGAR